MIPPNPTRPGSAKDPAKAGSGCATAVLVAMVALAGLGVLGVVGVLVVGALSERPAATDSRTGPSAAPLGIPPPLGPMGANDAPRAMHSGTCRRNDRERTKTQYLTAMRGRGAANALRGRVALIHLKLSTTDATWTAQASRSVTLTALVSRDYLLAQARRAGVADLSIDAIEWPLETGLATPQVRLDARDKVLESDGETLRRSTRLAIERALGRPMQGVVDGLRAKGYANVAFIVHFPSGPRGVRDFAAPTGAPGAVAEFAYLLEPDWNVTSRSALVVHEVLHLFGADDLYEMRGIAADEANDIMNAQCDGLGPTSIGPATAYAIGWTDAPPRRGYGFSAR